MTYTYSAILAVFLVATPSLVLGKEELILPDITVGQHLEAIASIKLSEMAPEDGVEITLTSGDPTQLLFSTAPETKGTPSMVTPVRYGQRETIEFYVQGIGRTGTATYTASASGLGSVTGTVTVAPSGIVITSGLLTKVPTDRVVTTVDARARGIRIYAALLDSSMHYVAAQPVAGGSSVSADIKSSDMSVGTVVQSKLTIPGGLVSAPVVFHASAPGSTNLIVSAPGFGSPSNYGQLTATVITPTIGLSDQVTVGKDLQFCDMLYLGGVAPQGGLAVTLASDNPNLLVSPAETSLGSKSATITVPAGDTHATYCFQALSDSGIATVTASAAGRRNRTSTVTLTPSGVLLGFRGPDEAELFREESAEKEHGIVINASSQEPVTFSLYTARLHPVNHRGADITVQALRPGISATVELKSTDPAVGTITSPVTLNGVSGARITFTPLGVGRTVISVSTPTGFTTPANATSYTVVVK